MDLLHALLLSQPIAKEADQPLPKWLASLLLAIEILLACSEEPRSATLVKAEEPVEIPKVTQRIWVGVFGDCVLNIGSEN